MVPRRPDRWQGRVVRLAGSEPALAVPGRLHAHEHVARVRVVDVAPGTAVRDVVALDAIVGRYAEIAPAAALHDVRSRVALDRITVGSALHVVLGASTGDQVGSSTPADVVRARPSGDPIVASTPYDPVGASQPYDRVVSV